MSKTTVADAIYFASQTPTTPIPHQDSKFDCKILNGKSGVADGSDMHSFEICNTLQLLEEGERKIILNKQYKNVTLVLGNTGAGKSTLVQWLVGDNEKLISKEVKEGSGQYLIEDGERISDSNSTTQSQTIFPEFMLDDETHTAYYDCPGFMDTRSTSHDIASTYFIKKVVAHADKVKLLLVVSYPTVRKGVDRQNFLILLKHVTDLIKDIDKFRDSVAVAVTKVDNLTRKVGKNYLLISDEIIIGAVGDFLREVQLSLKKGLQIPNISKKRRILYEKSISLLDLLLTREGGNYKRIGIFRRPDEPGPLSNIPLLQDGKKHFSTILNNNLQFTKIKDDDFGYTVSEKTKNDINDLVEAINENVWSLVSNIAKNAKEFYAHLVEELSKKVKTIDSGTLEINAFGARMDLEKLNSAENITTRLSNDVKHVNPDILAEKMYKTFDTLHLVSIKDDLVKLLNYGKYFSFLQMVTDKKFTSRQWATLLQEVPKYLQSSKGQVQVDIMAKTRELENNINIDLDLIANSIKKYYHNRMLTLDVQKLLAELRKGRDILRQMNQAIKGVDTAQELSKTVRDNTLLIEEDSNEIKKRTDHIFRLGDCIGSLKSISNEEITKLHSGSSSTSLKDAEKFLQESVVWYTFLSDLHVKLSRYSEQTNKSRYSSSITGRTLQDFFTKIKDLYVAEYATVKNSAVSGFQLEELNNVLDETLRGSVVRNCDGDTVVIRGGYIKFSDFIGDDGRFSNGCKDNIKSIHIFALNTLFVDRDLQATGRKLNVIAFAPKWEVIGKRIINLSGASAIPYYPSKNSGGESSGQSGQNGFAGKPGGSAGSFFGVGAEFSNGSNLKIAANGGKGGRGQDGGDGANGSDGATPTTNTDYYHDAFFCRDTLCQGSSDNRMRNFDCYYNFDSFSVLGTGFSFGLMLPSAAVTIFGKNGDRGGDGGKGGSGGMGGKPGHVRIISLGNEADISVSQNSGQQGSPGDGGGSGVGGKKGGDVKMLCYHGAISSGWREWWEYVETLGSNEVSASGTDGVSGASEAGFQSAEEPAIISNPLSIINDYKNYLRGNVNISSILFRKQSLMEFQKRLENMETVKNAAHTSGIHRLGRRSVGALSSKENSASSSAGKPSSWLTNMSVLAKSCFVSLGESMETMKDTVLDAVYPTVSDDLMTGAGPLDAPENSAYSKNPMKSDMKQGQTVLDMGDLFVNKTPQNRAYSLNSVNSDMKQGQTVLDMGDMLVNKTNINGLLTLLTLFVLKWTGHHSSKIFKKHSNDKSIEILMDTRYHQLDQVLKHLQGKFKVSDATTINTRDNFGFYAESKKNANRVLVKEDLIPGYHQLDQVLKHLQGKFKVSDETTINTRDNFGFYAESKKNAHQVLVKEDLIPGLLFVQVGKLALNSSGRLDELKTDFLGTVKANPLVFSG